MTGFDFTPEERFIAGILIRKRQLRIIAGLRAHDAIECHWCHVPNRDPRYLAEWITDAGSDQELAHLRCATCARKNVDGFLITSLAIITEDALFWGL